MFNESTIFALFFGAVLTLMVLIFVWLEGLLYFIQDMIASRTHQDRDLLVTEFNEWDIVYSTRTFPGTWVVRLLEE